jgi:hypothetical protein
MARHDCAACGDVEVSDEGEYCAGCLADEPRCNYCRTAVAARTGHLAGYCSIECRDMDEEGPFDTQEEARCER